MLKTLGGKMKKIFFIVMILFGFNVFSEENENSDMNVNKVEEVVIEGNNDEYLVSEETVTETDEFSNEKEDKNKMFRLKLVGGIDGEIRDNVAKNHISEAEITYELLLESVYRISETYEVAMGTGVQKLGTMKLKEIGFTKDYENVYAVPLYIGVKRNFFRGNDYFSFKTLWKYTIILAWQSLYLILPLIIFVALFVLVSAFLLPKQVRELFFPNTCLFCKIIF